MNTAGRQEVRPHFPLFSSSSSCLACTVGFLAGKQVLHVAACPGSTVTQVRIFLTPLTNNGSSTPGLAPGARGRAKIEKKRHPNLGELTMLLLTLLVSAVQGEDVTVSLSKGKLRGARLDYDFGQYYYAFKGIPYARPPVKELRFKVSILSQFRLYFC